jgi:hypothetical protein
MSEQKQIDNKQLIHIGCEVVALLGVSYYFSSKNKTLQNHIEELSQKLEEQEDKILKLEETMKSSMNMAFNQINSIINVINKPQPATQPVTQSRKVVSPIVKIVKQANAPQVNSPQVNPPQVNQEIKNDLSEFINDETLPPIIEESSESPEFHESPEEEDNDEDIQEELSELDSDLKKQD